MTEHLLSWIIFSPLLFLIAILVVPQVKITKYIALGATGFQLLLSILLFSQSNFSTADYSVLAYSEFSEWINFSLGSFGKFSADYFLGVDGLNIYLVLLSSLILFIGVISSWKIKTQQRGYFALYMILSTAILGCFLSLDLLLFFVFFEFMLLPMYFMIGIWGGPNREYAAIKFFLYTLVGSILILLVMIGLYSSAIDPIKTAVEIGLASSIDSVTPAIQLEVQKLLASGGVNNVVHTFNLLHLVDANNYIPDSVFALGSSSTILGYSARLVGFMALFIGFCIKLPIVPLHTWLPDAHVQAPTPVSVILAGILLKIGGYGLMRVVYPVFPEAGIYFSEFVSILGMVTILYAAYVSLAMKELKKLVAYSSVSHMGFVLLGIASYTSEGFSGALYQMISHGIISPMLFLITGVIYERTGKLRMTEYKGLVNQMPFFTAFVTVGFFASLGLPGFSGFISEVFVFLGAFSSSVGNGYVPMWIVILSLLGLIITAAYYLWALQRVFFGKFWVADESWKETLKDLTVREYVLLTPLAVITLLLGVFPHLILDNINGTINHLVEVLTH